MEKSQNEKSGSFEVRDPLGEIRRRAEELWADAGRPTGRSWEDFVPSAEEDLLAGGPGGVPSGRARRGFQRREVSDEVAFVRAYGENALVRAIADALTDLLDEHEAFSLAHLLRHNAVELAETNVLCFPDQESIALALAALAGEYPLSWLKDIGVASRDAATREQKLQYWNDRIREWNSASVALTFADRNTIQRLHAQLSQCDSFKSVAPR
ncbi:MAG: hypothetical protein IT290_08580 [Deltaproteobacteria bacterium]|nr:hypothetical protein [Deltaproteobacteria bacterium]